ncbi:hypothetical protein EYF80_057599 [Liparis tanakae]|uniref:Uncharacterized protein n=1 Tax=Liparis tanakae TaxID=230148 RepID=A0A4Z2EUC6_9TELE|nr:hypothetical protein EYF80_057599 [Liparis tanakae]
MLLRERSSGSLSSSLVKVVADSSPWFCITRVLRPRISLSCRASTEYSRVSSPAETSTTAVKRLISSASSRSAASFSLNSHMELSSSPAPSERSASRP